MCIHLQKKKNQLKILGNYKYYAFTNAKFKSFAMMKLHTSSPFPLPGDPHLHHSCKVSASRSFMEHAVIVTSELVTSCSVFPSELYQHSAIHAMITYDC